MTDKFAVVTGASIGLGYQFAPWPEDGCRFPICADEEGIHAAADKLSSLGADVEDLVIDRSTRPGGGPLWSALGKHDVDLFCVSAERLLGRAFAKQDWIDVTGSG